MVDARLLALAGALLLVPVGAIAAPGDKKAEAAVKKLTTEDLPTKERRTLVRELKGMGDRAAAPLARALLGGRLTPGKATRVIELLARLGSPEAEDALLKTAASSDDATVLGAIARALAERKPSKAVSAAMFELLENDDVPRASILDAFAKQRSASAWRPLLEKTAAEALPARAAASALAAILEAHPSPKRVAQLLEACVDAKPSARRTLFSVLEGCEHKVVVPFMTRFLADAAPATKAGHPETKADAPPAVTELFDGEGAPLSAMRPFHPDLLALAASALGNAEAKEAFPILLRCTYAKSAELRAAALQNVGSVTSGRSAKQILIRQAITCLSDSDNRVKARAHELLRNLTGESLPLSFTKWSAWFHKANKAAIQKAAEAIAAEEGFDDLAEFLEREGYQGLDDYLRDGGMEKVEEYLLKNPDAGDE